MCGEENTKGNAIRFWRAAPHAMRKKRLEAVARAGSCLCVHDPVMKVEGKMLRRMRGGKALLCSGKGDEEVVVSAEVVDD